LELARITASVTHNHPEGIKGAQAVAAAVYLQLNEMFSKDGKIKQFVEEKFGYNLDIKLEDIRDDYHFDVTCQKRAIRAEKLFTSIIFCRRRILNVPAGESFPRGQGR
jgi:ADP-ribosylglycohydrolase